MDAFFIVRVYFNNKDILALLPSSDKSFCITEITIFSYECNTACGSQKLMILKVCVLLISSDSLQYVLSLSCVACSSVS